MNDQSMMISDPQPAQGSRRLYRSRTDRQVAGVCGGVGEYLGIDPTLIRIAWLVSILFAGTGFFAYLACAIVIPEEDSDHAASKPQFAQRGATIRAWASNDSNRGLFWGGVLIAVGILVLASNLDIVPLRAIWRTFWQFFWPMVLIGLGIILLLGISGHSVDWKGALRGERSLTRSRNRRMIGGVCAGLAAYLGIDASVVRIVWVIGSLATLGLGVMAYVIALVVMPEAPNTDLPLRPQAPPPGTTV